MIGRKDSTTEKLYRILANFSRSVKNMIGATHSSDGAAGLVPPPRAGDEDKALLGNGTWGKVDSIYKYKTEEEYNQAVANNEIPDGATVIKEWDEELSVIPVDSELSEESLNPLQNKIITQKISELNQSIEELNTLLNGMDETLSGKLDVSKIANNLVTTEEGYALDARMGKELADRHKNLNDLFCPLNKEMRSAGIIYTNPVDNTHSYAYVSIPGIIGKKISIIYYDVFGTGNSYGDIFTHYQTHNDGIIIQINNTQLVGYLLQVGYTLSE